MIKTILLGISILMLTGCASYNSTFECKPNCGVGCKSVSKVNSMVDSGSLPHDPDKTGSKVKKQTVRAKHKLPFPQVIPENLQSFDIARKPEAVLRIWLAPYVSQEGAYQEAQYIHEVVEPGSWIEERSL